MLRAPPGKTKNTGAPPGSGSALSTRFRVRGAISALASTACPRRGGDNPIGPGYRSQVWPPAELGCRRQLSCRRGAGLPPASWARASLGAMTSHRKAALVLLNAPPEHDSSLGQMEWGSSGRKQPRSAELSVDVIAGSDETPRRAQSPGLRRSFASESSVGGMRRGTASSAAAANGGVFLTGATLEPRERYRGLPAPFGASLFPVGERSRPLGPTHASGSAVRDELASWRERSARPGAESILRQDTSPLGHRQIGRSARRPQGITKPGWPKGCRVCPRPPRRPQGGRVWPQGRPAGPKAPGIETPRGTAASLTIPTAPEASSWNGD